MVRYGMTNESCPLGFCLQISSRGFEHSCTFILGSINDSDKDRKWLLKTFAVRFFGTSAEVERCPFVNTYRARHTDVDDDNSDNDDDDKYEEEEEEEEDKDVDDEDGGGINNSISDSLFFFFFSSFWELRSEVEVAVLGSPSLMQ